MRTPLDRYERLSALRVHPAIRPAGDQRQRPLRQQAWLLALAILSTSCLYALGFTGCGPPKQADTPTPALQPTSTLIATALPTRTPVPVATVSPEAMATSAPTLRASATLTASFILADTSTPQPTPPPPATRTSPPTATGIATIVEPTAATRVSPEAMATVSPEAMATTEPGPSPAWTATPVPTEPPAPTATHAPAATPTQPLTNPAIRFEPAASAVQAGTTLVIEVRVENVVDLGSYELTVTFSPAVVNVQGVTLGSFLGSTGRSTTPLGPIIDNGAGQLTFGAFSFGTGSGPGGTGTIAQVTLQAMAAGSSNLTITEAQLTDTVGRVLKPLTRIPGTVTIQ